MRTPALFATATVLLVGCTPRIDVEQERTALMSTDREWSQATTDPDRFASYYAPDASFYASGMPLVKGQAGIRGVIGQLMSLPGFALTVSATDTQVSAAGDIGYITGTYELKLESGVEKGKYVTVWKKQPDGRWRIFRDIGNTDQPAP